MASNKKYLHKNAMNFPLYPGKFVIVFSNSPKKVNKLVKFKDTYVYGHSIEGEYKGHYAYFMILNFHYSGGSKISNGTVAHESVHIAMFLMERIGSKIDFNNPEPFTYLVGWITNEIHKFAAKHNFKIH